jgi:hypothetical protein
VEEWAGLIADWVSCGHIMGKEGPTADRE